MADKFLNLDGLTRLVTKVKALVTGITGDPANLTTTTKTDLVAAVNSVKAEVDGLGEPFRLQDFQQQINLNR